jgi:hypothetical protein
MTKDENQIGGIKFTRIFRGNQYNIVPLMEASRFPCREHLGLIIYGCTGLIPDCPSTHQ